MRKRFLKSKKENLKQFHVRNLKVFKGTCNLLAPFVIMGGIVVGGFKVCNGGFPFYRDNITKYKRYDLEYETDDLINATEGYVRNEWWSDYLPSNFLNICTPWEREEDHYVRYNRNYNVSHDSFFDVYDAIFRKDFEYIEENYEKSEEEKEVSDDFPGLKNDYFLETELYMLDNNDQLKVPESSTKNVIITIVELVITLGIGGLIVHLRDYDYFDDLQEIKDDYHSNIKSIEYLEEELDEVKKKILTLTVNRGGDNNG